MSVDITRAPYRQSGNVVRDSSTETRLWVIWLYKKMGFQALFKFVKCWRAPDVVRETVPSSWGGDGEREDYYRGFRLNKLNTWSCRQLADSGCTSTIYWFVISITVICFHLKKNITKITIIFKNDIYITILVTKQRNISQSRDARWSNFKLTAPFAIQL